MQPTQPKSEVVYRKPTVDPATPEKRRGFAPALMPLIIGFLLLLALIVVLGLRSAKKTDEIGLNAVTSALDYSARLGLLLDLRLKFAQLNNEARARHREESSREFAPPLGVKLDKAREEAKAAMVLVDHPPLSEDPSWMSLRYDLENYLLITQDPRRYGLEGYESYRKVDVQLTNLFASVQGERDKIIDDVDKSKSEARRLIILWTLFAMVVGTMVAVGTVWQVQRHFRDMRRSVLETRRERLFTTQLVQGMVSAVAAFDEEDRIRSANAAFFHIFPNASIGASVMEKLGPDDAMKMLETVTSIRVTKATYHGRSIARVDEEDKAFDVYSSPLAINGDRGQVITLVDATEAAESERTLRRSESLAAVGQATTQVAHEIRNPLGSIRLGVSMLRDSVNDQDALNTIELVERGISHLNKLVIDVTQFSRQKELERSTVDLHDSLERSIDLVSDKIAEKNATVEKHFSGTSIVGHWDAYQLRQVFVNVIANAVDASQENSAVQITTELLPVETNGDGQQPRHYARITITDHGKGMDKPTRDRIFEPFFSTKKRGTGLGLAIVKQIVEQHGGRISVASAPGEGSKFKIDLPV
jgi:signal transduction histidine kinase